jgi:hypothetical protein
MMPIFWIPFLMMDWITGLITPIMCYLLANIEHFSTALAAIEEAELQAITMSLTWLDD